MNQVFFQCKFGSGSTQKNSDSQIASFKPKLLVKFREWNQKIVFVIDLFKVSFKKKKKNKSNINTNLGSKKIKYKYVI